MKGFKYGNASEVLSKVFRGQGQGPLDWGPSSVEALEFTAVPLQGGAQSRWLSWEHGWPGMKKTVVEIKLHQIRTYFTHESNHTSTWVIQKKGMF